MKEQILDFLQPRFARLISNIDEEANKGYSALQVRLDMIYTFRLFLSTTPAT